jgi:UDP-N-acetylmuramoylalanine--D-glutamate ligase
MSFEGKRVTVMGLGHFGGGIAAARWLANQGALVTVTDLADENTLTGSLAKLEGVSITRFRLGGHRVEDFHSADLVVVNPAVRPNDRFLQVAEAAGVPKTTETELFLNHCPARIIGVTGTNGKSTTSAMVAAILRAAGRQAWLGGNIGVSLLERLDQIGSPDWVVLELSSFQLWHLAGDARMPQIAVVTNCSPNHLNWHEDYQHYVAAKQRILALQSAGHAAVLNTLDREVSSWQECLRGRQIPLVSEDEVPELAVPGEHNRINARLAITAARAAGCQKHVCQEALRSFSGLAGRLEPIAVINGRRFINDTTATTPESTIAALESMDTTTWLLAGGVSKGVDLEALIDSIVRHTGGAAFFGATGADLLAGLRARLPDFPAVAKETMKEALRWCWQASRPGDSILLSPACASYDQYQNFQQRGEEFVRLVWC